MKKVSSVALSTMLAITWLMADDSEIFRYDIGLMQQQLKAYNSFSAMIDVVNKSDELALPPIHAVIKRQGDSVYYKVMQFEFLFTAAHSIMVDHKKKLIAYTSPDSKVRKSAMEFLPSADSIYTRYDSVIYLGIVNGSRKYRVFNQSGIIAIADVYFDPTLKFLSKMVYTYNKELTGSSAILTVEYSHVRYDQVFTNEFEECQFVRLSGKAAIPAPALSGYTITEAQISNDNF